MKLTLFNIEIECTAAEAFELIDRYKPNDKELKPAAPKPAPKKQTKPKKDIDLGKVRALREGGWAIEKIADELRVSPPTIKARLTEMGLS